MTTSTLLWIYVALLLGGGLMGFLKAKSKISLITSLVFGGFIALSAAGILPASLATLLIGVLVIVFSLRLIKTRKFMPAGLMLLVSAITLVLLLAVGRL